MSSSSVTFFSNGQLDTLTLWQGDVWLTLFTDNENVVQSGDESVVQGVLDVNQVETTIVSFLVNDSTDTTQVTTTGDVDQLTNVELDVVSDLTGSQVDLDGVIDLDVWVWVSDSSTIVSDNVWNTLLTQLDLLDLNQLVGSFFVSDTVDSESTLDVVDQSEVFVGSFQGDNIHETSWVGSVSSDLTVNLNMTLHHDSLNFTTVQSVL